MHHPTDRIAHTTAFVTPVVEHWLEREIAQWVHPMKDRSDDPSHHERKLLPRSYISLRTEQYPNPKYNSYSNPVLNSNADPNLAMILNLKFKFGRDLVDIIPVVTVVGMSVSIIRFNLHIQSKLL